MTSVFWLCDFFGRHGDTNFLSCYVHVVFLVFKTVFGFQRYVAEPKFTSEGYCGEISLGLR